MAEQQKPADRPTKVKIHRPGETYFVHKGQEISKKEADAARRTVEKAAEAETEKK